MAEGGIYLCKWDERNGEYKLWLRANPDLQVSGRDLNECMEDICLQIIGWNGDGEAVLELFPPQGKKSVPGGAILLAGIGYNDSARVLDYGALFEGGACPVCKFGVGTRSDAVLRFESRPKGMVCATDGCYPILLIFNKKFVDMLSNEERANFEIRPVFFNDNQTDYFELIANKTIRTVGYKGANYPTSFQQSFRCSKCGREKYDVEAEGFKNGTSFIDANDIDTESSTMVVIDDSWRQFPAFRLSRWEQLLERRDRRGLLSDELVVLDSDYVEHPALEVCNEFDWVM